MIPASSSVRQPRVSRETRRLLAAAAIAFVMLSVLARIRFPDQPATANPVAPVLNQLVPRRTLGDLAAELGALRRRIEPYFVALDNAHTGFRAMPDAVVTLLPEDRTLSPRYGVLAADRATGLTLVAADVAGTTFESALWSPEDPAQPTFLVSAASSAGGVVLQPLYVASLTPVESPLWSGRLWLPPRDTVLTPGTFLFSTDAELAGLAISRNGAPAIVPAATLMNALRALRASPVMPPGYLGVEVQPLTPDLAAAVGGANGLIVAWIDAAGPAAQVLRPGDVIESIAGDAATSYEWWQATAGRVDEGQSIMLDIRRGNQRLTVMVTGAPAAAQPAAAAGATVLGLTLRRVAAGAEITRVDAPSAASAAGLRTGDVIHLAGTQTAPTPAAVRAAFQATAPGSPLLVAVTRGETRQVLTLKR